MNSSSISPYEAERLRRLMVAEQLQARGIRDPRVLRAMLRVPRHRFVPPELAASAYEDGPLPIGQGQTISQPYMVALMTQCLELTGTERVLEVGTGSGYQSAVLAELCRWVYTVERIPELAARAERTLRELGYHNVSVRVGDGTLGWPEEAPFEGILVTAGAPEAPPALLEQLAEGGRLVIPVGTRYSQTLQRITRRGGRLEVEEFGPCVFVPLVGRQGWPEE